MGGAVAVILLKERQVVDAFVRAGATSPERAVEPERIGVDTYALGWRRLTERAVVREPSPGSGRYYVDVEVWSALRRQRRRMVLAILAIVVALLALGVFTAPLRY